MKASFTQLSQYNHQLRETALSLPTDMWIPIAGDFKAAEEPQGIDRSLLQHQQPLHAVDGSLLQANVQPHRLSRRLLLLPSNTIIYEKLIVGDGKVRGIDMSVRKTFGNITGHISYSMLWNERRFEKKNNGQNFHRPTTTVTRPTSWPTGA